MGNNAMRVEFIRHPNGKHLRCTRDDQTVTWETREKHGEYFAMHDLTHFAVETVCHFREGFFGLLSQGWAIEETTGKSPRGALPLEAGIAENLVGLLQAEAASGAIWTPQDFAEAGSVRPWTLNELQQVRKLRSELLTQWSETSRLTLEFQPGAASIPQR